MNGLNAYERQDRTTGAVILDHHAKLSVEGIGRMYLNVFVPGLQYERGIVRYVAQPDPTRRMKLDTFTPSVVR